MAVSPRKKALGIMSDKWSAYDPKRETNHGTHRSLYVERLARLIAWTLIIVGASSIAAGISYSMWLMWNYPTDIFFNILVPATVLGGVVVAAVGLAILSSIKS